MWFTTPPGLGGGGRAHQMYSLRFLVKLAVFYHKIFNNTNSETRFPRLKPKEYVFNISC